MYGVLRGFEGFGAKGRKDMGGWPRSLSSISSLTGNFQQGENSITEILRS